MENWQTVLFMSMRSNINKYIVTIYLVSWVFIGNFILLNLFLAILLDSFLEAQEEIDEEHDREEAVRIKKLKKLYKQ